MHIRGPTIQTYEGPQGPGTMLLKSGTGRPGNSGTVEAFVYLCRNMIFGGQSHSYIYGWQDYDVSIMIAQHKGGGIL